MDQERIAFENDRGKVYEELHKLQTKIEEEIKLRLFFESKLNSLHHVNMEHESKHKLVDEKYEALRKLHQELSFSNHKIIKEHEELSTHKAWA